MERSFSTPKIQDSIGRIIPRTGRDLNNSLAVDRAAAEASAGRRHDAAGSRSTAALIPAFLGKFKIDMR
jgi:hypothetical protein